MIKFLDGPAAGVTLPLGRAPLLLRVTHDGQNWDALDMPRDQAQPNEKIYLYTAVEMPQPIHLNMRPRSGSGWYFMGQYKQIESPPDDVLRDNNKFSTWCDANRTRLIPEWAKGKVDT